MASAILSRLLPPGTGEPSIYETLQENDENSHQSDIEERAGMALDEENLGEGFQNYELNDALAGSLASQATLSRVEGSNRTESGQSAPALAKPRKGRRSIRNPMLEDPNDDVPQSLLFEGGDNAVAEAREGGASELPPPVPGPTTPDAHAKWLRTQAKQRIHPDLDSRSPQPRYVPRKTRASDTAHPREQAMWRWANVENLDNFLKDVYDYFLGNGIKCILLSRVLNLL